MRLNLNKLILDEMTHGVIQLDRRGVVVGYNRASEPWLSRFRALQDSMKRAIDEELRGKAQFPIPLDRELAVQEPRAHNWKAWLCKDGRNAYAVFIVAHPYTGAVSVTADAPQGPAEKAAPDNYMALMGDAARGQLTQFQEQLRASVTAGGRDVAGILRNALGLSQLLQHMSDLSLLSQRDLVFSDQRISLSRLVGEAIEEAQRRSNDKAVSYTFEPGVEQQGVLYGNFVWLNYALVTLLNAMYKAAPNYSCIEIGSHQFGDFLVVKGNVLLVGNAKPVRLARSCDSRSASELNGVANSALQEEVAMRISERIIELHGGRIKLNYPQSDAGEIQHATIDSFQLTLLTGMPEHDRSRASCAECPAVRQAHAFAQDLSELLNQQSQR